MLTHTLIVERLRNAGINPVNPGFYDDPAFVAEEATNPGFLDEYARFVASLPTDKAYAARARREVPVIARALHGELVADGRLGACVDVGMIFSRILEQEGFWNYQVKGGLTIQFPAGSGIRTKYFWSFDLVEQPFAAAHSWLVVPPFQIADIAIKQQPYSEGAELLPKLVLTEAATPSPPRDADVFSPEFQAEMLRLGVSTSDLAAECAPNWLALRGDLPPVEVNTDGLALRYTTVGIGAPDLPFEKMNIWKMNGRLGPEVYREVVVPALTALRRRSAT